MTNDLGCRPRFRGLHRKADARGGWSQWSRFAVDAHLRGRHRRLTRGATHARLGRKGFERARVECGAPAFCRTRRISFAKDGLGPRIGKTFVASGQTVCIKCDVDRWTTSRARTGAREGNIAPSRADIEVGDASVPDASIDDPGRRRRRLRRHPVRTSIERKVRATRRTAGRRRPSNRARDERTP